MKKHLSTILFLLLAMDTQSVFCQSPVISYSSPQTYSVGNAISPLAPSNSGGTVNSPGAASMRYSPANGAVDYPSALAFDPAGNLYVSEGISSSIVKIPAGGGAPVIIFSGSEPTTGLACDAAGNIYFSDAVDGEIAEIAAAGGDPFVFATGFNNPKGIAVDAAGNVYVADEGNNAIEEIFAATGIIRKLGNGFGGPFAIAVDAARNVYFLDDSNNTIDEIPFGGNSVLIHSAFPFMEGVAVDGAGNLYVTFGNQNVDAAGLGTQAGVYMFPSGGGSPIALYASEFSPTSIAISPANTLFVGNYIDGYTSQTPGGYISEENFIGGYYLTSALPAGLNLNNTTGIISGTPTQASSAANYSINAYNTIGSSKATVNIQVILASPIISYNGPQTYNVGSAIKPLSPQNTGYAVAAPGYSSTPTALTPVFSGPQSVAVDSKGNIYVADTYNNAIKKIPAGGGTPVVLGSGFSSPAGVAVDAAGNVYVADSGDDAVKMIPAGNGTPVAVGSGFSAPAGVAVDAAGNIYVADQGNSEIVKVPAGNGTPVALGSGFLYPSGVAVDAAGNVYVADRSHNAVKEIPVGSGTPVVLGSGFNLPSGIAVDPAGNVFVADEGNNAIKMIAAGSSSPVTLGSGFNLPAGVMPDASGNLLVADAGSNSVKKLSPVGGYFLSSFLPAGLSFSSNTGVISGTPTAASPATNYTITAYNGSGTGTAVVNIAVSAASSNPSLSSLALSNGTLSPAFAAGTTGYTSAVGNAIASITVTPAAPAGLTIAVNNAIVASGSASAAIPLVVGVNTVTIVVTGSDGVTTKTYTVTVTRAASTDAYLGNLKVTTATLSPTFAFKTLSYTSSVSNATASVTVTPTLLDATASAKVNGVAVANKIASGAIALNVGSNTITILVTAQDGKTTETYTVAITRAASTNDALAGLKLSSGSLTPAFATGTTSYTCSVSNGTTSITVTPTTADPTATVTVNGTATTSGTASAAIALNVGSNTITTIVTAQDGVTTKTYTVTVTRAPSTNAALAGLKVTTATLSPTFSTKTLTYTSSVANTTSSVTVTPTLADATATIKVDGTAVANKTASGAIALAVGSNTITILITAQDGVTKETYTITITRAASGADQYSPGISVTKPTETPAFADDGIMVHQAVSPNGDGINDFLQIDNISQYPDNKLSIMNRNGQLIYEAVGYDNSTKVFDGHSNKNGQMQLPGTYFYQLDYTINGIVKHKTGFLVLKY